MIQARLTLLFVLFAWTLGCGSNPPPRSASSPTLDPSHSTFAVSGPSIVADGQPALTLTATLVDPGGAPLRGVQVDLFAADASAPFASGATNAAGVYSAQFGSKVAGRYTFQALARLAGGDVRLTQEPSAELVAGPPAVLTFTAPPSDEVAGVQLAPVVVSLLDANGNPTGTDGLDVRLRAPGLLGTSTAQTSKGSATFSDLKFTVAGSHGLVASSAGVPDATSPGFQVLPAPADAARSSISASPSSPVADGRSSETVTLSFKDPFDNPVPGVGYALEVSGSGNSASSVSGSSDASGNASLTFSSTRAETKTITLSTPFPLSRDVTFVAGAADATRSGLAVSPASPVADGVTPTTVTFTARDAFDNPVAGVSFTLSVSGTGNSASSASGTTDASGDGSLTFTSTRAETKTVALSSPFPLSRDVTFLPGPPASLTFSSTPAGPIYAGEVLAPLQVREIDANGNLETTGAQPITLSLSGSASVALTGTQTRTPVDGTASFDDVAFDGSGTGLTLVATSGALVTTVGPFDASAWRQIGPWAGDVEHLALLGYDTLYAGTANGVYVSSDYGAHWSPFLSGMGPQSITALGSIWSSTGAFPPRLLAATESSGVFERASDGSGWFPNDTGLGGAKVRKFLFVDASHVLAATDAGCFVNSGNGWVASNSGLTDLDLTALAESGAGSPWLWVGTAQGHVFLSTDSGATWTDQNASFGEPVVGIDSPYSDLSRDPTYVATRSGVYAEDASSQWSSDPLTSSTSIVALITDDSYLGMYLVTEDQGVLFGNPLEGSDPLHGNPFSRLGGGDVPMGPRDYVWDYDPQAQRDDGSYLATATGFYRSQGSAYPWQASSAGMSAATIRALSFDPADPTHVYAATSSGLFKSTDSGLTWSESDSGLTSTSFCGVAVEPAIPDQLLALSTHDGLFLSTDDTATWGEVPGSAAALDAVAFAQDPDVAFFDYGWFVATASAGVYRAGAHIAGWEQSNRGLTDLSTTSLWVDPSPNQRVFVTTAGGVFLSTDQAYSWSPRNSGLTSLNTTVIARVNGVLYVGTDDAGLFSSTDDGSSWTPVGAGALPVHIQAISGDENELFVGTDAGLFRSGDAGATWTASQDNGVDSDVTALALVPGSPSVLLVGTRHSGVFRSLAFGR